MANQRRACSYLIIVIVATATVFLRPSPGQRDPRRTQPPALPGDSVGVLQNEHPARSAYTKMQPPAEVSLQLASNTSFGQPVTLLVQASAAVPVTSAVLKLRMPVLGDQPEQAVVLWTGTWENALSQTQQYRVNTLTPGTYSFAALLEFTPADGEQETLVVSDALFLDVRPDAVLSSNVSFEQIKRLELRRELEQRVLASLRPNFKSVDARVVARELTRVESANPGIVESKMAELKATDPYLAERIRAMNRYRADAPAEADSARAAGDPPNSSGTAALNAPDIVRGFRASEKDVSSR